MKAKVTFKEIRNNYSTIINVGYCELDTLLKHKAPFGYNAGLYGWNCDFYDVESVCICTGYRPIGKYSDYKITKEYEQKARKISNNYDLKYEIKEKRIAKLLSEFVKIMNDYK